MRVSLEEFRTLILLLFWQCVGALIGVGVDVLLWLQSASPKREELTDLVIIVVATAVAVFWALRKLPQVRTRVLLFSLVGAVAAWLLAPTSSATFNQRLAGIFSDPFFAFRPLSFASSAVVGGLIGYFLPTLRKWLATLNGAENGRGKGDAANTGGRKGGRKGDATL